MLRKKLIFILLVTASMPTWGLDIKPGLWGVTRVTESEAPLPPAIEKKASYVECITQEDIDDPAGTFQNDFNESGFDDVEYMEVGNTVHVTAINTSHATDVSINLVMTILNDQHTQSVSELSGTGSFRMIQEARWVKEDC